jgi:hypothetical protein
MSASITATVGSASANSYLTIAAADTIAATMLGTLAWTTATTDEKTRALITATRGLDTLDWIGYRATETQALDWPRTGAACGDLSYADNEIPEPIQYSTFDLANALLTTPNLLQSPTGSSGSLLPGIPNRDLSRLKLDVVEVEWRTNVSGASQSIVTPLSALPHLATVLGCLTTSTIPGPQPASPPASAANAPRGKLRPRCGCATLSA